MHSVIDLVSLSDQTKPEFLRSKSVAYIHIVNAQMLLSIRIVSILLSTSIVSGQMLLSVRIVSMLLSTSISPYG